MHDGASEIFLGLHQLERRLGRLDGFVGLPGEAPPHDVRMKRAHEHRDAPQRHAARFDPAAQLLEYLLGARGRRRALGEPVEEALDAVRHPRFDGGGGIVSTKLLRARIASPARRMFFDAASIVSPSGVRKK